MAVGKTWLDSAEIRRLARRSDLMGAALVVHCWGVVAAAIALFAWAPSVVTFVLAVMVIGSRQLGFAILMHDGAHNALFASGRLNRFAGQWLCARPILADMATYRTYHLLHHRFTQTADDPDLVLSAAFPTTRASLVRKFARDILGRTGLRQRLAQVRTAVQLAFDRDAIDGARMARSFRSADLRPALAVNAVLFAAMWAAGAWWWWLAFWLLPLMTWFQVVVRLRNIAEHAAVPEPDNPLRNTRTTMAGPLMGLFVAPYWVNYHLEHHLVMHVPCWRLREMHRLLIARGLGPEMETAPSYWHVLGRVGWFNRGVAA